MKKLLLSIGLLPLLAVLSIADSQFQVKRFFNNNGGLVDRVNRLIIPENSVTEIVNFTLDDRGQRTRRTGYINLSDSSDLEGSPITGGGYHNAASGNNFFALIVGTSVYKTNNTFNGTYSVVTGTVVLTNAATNLAQTTSLNDYLIFCNETDRPFKLASTGNAVMLSSTTLTNAKTCATYGNYLVAGNTVEATVAYPSRVRWSDINNPDSFPTNNYIDVEPNDGDKVVSVVSFEDSVYIFKKRSVYKMSITGLDGASAFIIRPISRNIGAWAKNSVKAIPNVGVAFLAQNTVYVLSDDGLDPIGDNIQRTFDGLTRAQWQYAVSAVYPKRYQYWLSVSNGSTNKNAALVYDYVQKAWTIYNGMAMNMLAQAEDSNGSNVLLSGDYSGFHYKQDSGAADYPLGVVRGISGSFSTSYLHLDSPEYSKNFKYLYVFYRADLSSVLNITGYFDYDDTSAGYSTSLLVGEGQSAYDVAIYDTDIYARSQYGVARVEINRSAKAIKLNFTNASSTATTAIIGWALVYQMEDWRQ